MGTVKMGASFVERVPIWYKRLEAGTYELPAAGEDQTHVTLTPTRLSLLLGGIELSSVRERKRYRRPQ